MVGSTHNKAAHPRSSFRPRPSPRLDVQGQSQGKEVFPYA